MTTGQDDMVIAYRLGQEIVHPARIVEPDDLLCTAQIALGLIAHQLSFLDEMARKIAGNLEYGHRPLGHVTTNGHTDA